MLMILRHIKKLQEHKEKDTLAKLSLFTNQIREAKKDTSTEGLEGKQFEAEVPKSWKNGDGGSMSDRLADIEDEEEDEEDDTDWRSHTLVFEKTAEDKRNERAQLESLATVDSRKKGEGDQRSHHERRLRPGPKASGRW